MDPQGKTLLIEVFAKFMPTEAQIYERAIPRWPLTDLIHYILSIPNIDPNARDAAGNSALAYALKKLKAHQMSETWGGPEQREEYEAIYNEYLMRLIEKMSAEALKLADNEGWTPMMRAVDLPGGAPLMKGLIAKGIDPRLRFDNAKTSLILAIEQHDPDKTKLLLDNGADVTEPWTNISGTMASTPEQIAFAQPSNQAGAKEVEHLIVEAVKQKKNQTKP